MNRAHTPGILRPRVERALPCTWSLFDHDVRQQLLTARLVFAVRGGKRGRWCVDTGSGGVKCNARYNVDSTPEAKFFVERLDCTRQIYALRGGKDHKYCADEGDRTFLGATAHALEEEGGRGCYQTVIIV